MSRGGIRRFDLDGLIHREMRCEFIKIESWIWMCFDFFSFSVYF